ncbi:hypothetical protein HDU67_004884, partial [Dinochytrium kinnereticum]
NVAAAAAKKRNGGAKNKGSSGSNKNNNNNSNESCENATKTVTVTVTQTVGAGAEPTQAGGSQGDQQQQQQSKVPKAIYINVNDPSQNMVAAIPVNADGTVDTAKMTLTPTGGIGGIGKTLDAATNQLIDADVDPLFSQGAVTSNGDFVFAVNAGCNSVTMFKTDPANRTKLTMVGTPKNTMGEFPVSVAFSPVINTACVLNGGQKDGIACFGVDAVKGLTPLDKTARLLNFNQTTPPVGPVATASHVFFKPDGSALFATIKGDPADPAKTGFLASFQVKNGKVGRKVGKSVPQGSKVLFGSSFAGTSDTLVATDAAFGALSFTVDPATGLAVAVEGGVAVDGAVGVTTVDGQTATCWAAFSAGTQTTFVTDIGKGRFVEIDPVGNNGTIVSIVDAESQGVNGMIDLAVGGDFIYSLAPATNAVVVLDNSLGRGQ